MFSTGPSVRTYVNLSVRLSVRPSVRPSVPYTNFVNKICYKQMNRLCCKLTQVDGGAIKGVKRSTLGVRRSKVKITGGLAEALFSTLLGRVGCLVSYENYGEIPTVSLYYVHKVQ